MLCRIHDSQDFPGESITDLDFHRALGVTMLYVMKKITFPDARGRQGHPKQLYWMIAEVNRRTSHHHHHTNNKAPSAVIQMQQWLNEVNEAKAKLSPRDDKLHALVSQMLIPSPNQRISMAKVVRDVATVA